MSEARATRVAVDEVAGWLDGDGDGSGLWSVDFAVCASEARLY